MHQTGQAAQLGGMTVSAGTQHTQQWNQYATVTAKEMGELEKTLSSVHEAWKSIDVAQARLCVLADRIFGCMPSPLNQAAGQAGVPTPTTCQSIELERELQGLHGKVHEVLAQVERLERL